MPENRIGTASGPVEVMPTGHVLYVTLVGLCPCYCALCGEPSRATVECMPGDRLEPLLAAIAALAESRWVVFRTCMAHADLSSCRALMKEFTLALEGGRAVRIIAREEDDGRSCHGR